LGWPPPPKKGKRRKKKEKGERRRRRKKQTKRRKRNLSRTAEIPRKDSGGRFLQDMFSAAGYGNARIKKGGRNNALIFFCFS